MAMADMFETIDTCPVPVIARVHGAALGGGMGLCAVADVVDRRERDPVRVHRDAPRDPARRHQPVRGRQDRRIRGAGAVPGRTPVRCRSRAADRAGPRGRRRRGSPRCGGRGGGPRHPGRRTDGGSGGQGDRPRDPRPGARVGEVAHGADDRPPARHARGTRGSRGVRRETPAGVGARRGSQADAALDMRQSRHNARGTDS